MVLEKGSNISFTVYTGPSVCEASGIFSHLILKKTNKEPLNIDNSKLSIMIEEVRLEYPHPFDKEIYKVILKGEIQ